MRQPVLPLFLLTPFLASAESNQKPIAQLHLSDSETCPHPHISCPTSKPSNIDTCCLNHPSGHFLLTQFWDISPSLGPSDSWTIHGLWPDLCHGGFEQFCDSSRAHSDIRSILSKSSSSDLTDFMSKYWLSINGDNNHLWSHEWTKHGTCISTLEPDCYPDSSEDHEDDFHNDIIDYFTHAATLFSTLNTYDAFAASNIIPTSRRAYDLDDLQSAISTLQGAEVTFRCHGNELQEIWYHFTVHGPLRNATTFTNESIAPAQSIAAAKHKFRAVEPDGSKTNCPATGIRYLPKQPHQPAPTHTSSSSSSTSTSSPTSTSTPFSGKGHLLVRPISNSSSSSTTTATTQSSSSSSSSGIQGCLIRSGAWYLTSGSSCAKYIAKSDPKHILEGKIDDRIKEHLAWQNDDSSDTAPDAPEHPYSWEYFTDEVYMQPVHPFKNTDAADDDDDDDDYLFTLSSLYAPCAVIPPAFAPEGGLFTCGKNLGIQSIFSSVCDDDSSSSSSSSSKDCKSGKYKLAHLGKTTFYAENVPEKFEKVGIYSDDKDGEREVQVEIVWEAL